MLCGRNDQEVFMGEIDHYAVRMLNVMSELARDAGWAGAWAALLQGSPDGAQALAEWIAAQPEERRAELCLMFTGKVMRR